MRLKEFYFLAFLLLSFSVTLSCSTEDDTPPDTEMTDPDDPDGEDPEDPDDPDGEDPNNSDTVQFFNESLVYDGLILINNAAANSVYLMNKNGNVLFDWPLNGKRLGNDMFLLPDGNLLSMVEAEDPKIEIGGFGGSLQLLDKAGETIWGFDYSSDDYILHHDAEMLPNGNVLVMVWERKSMEEAQEAGSNLSTEVFPEGIIEYDPVAEVIVWEWYAWDHLIQDHDETKTNYGVVAEHPERVDLNYVPQEEGDIMHANGIAYDPEKDLIYLSVNFYHEVWVIDHSTTPQEASSTTGGTYNKGGDLVYRFGNPEAYDNPMGERLFYNNHYPNLLNGDDTGKMLIFTNGNGMDQSTVYELVLPETFSLLPDTNNEPVVNWSFTHPDLYSPKVSGAVKLPNGNVLITEGDYGVWEVTQGGEVVWKFHAPGFYWRAYHYEKDAPEIMALGL